MVEVHHHRPTLKQTNKPFKSKHATKSSLKDQAKGRVSRQSPKASQTQKVAAQLRVNRKNASKQDQVKKRHSLVSATRIFNGVNGTPRIVAVVPLTSDVNARAAATRLAGALDEGAESCPSYGSWKLKAARFKTSLQFVNLPYRQFYSTLDACKAADYVLFVLSPEVEVDQWGDVLLRSLQAQGLPSVVACVCPDQGIDAKSRTGILKSLHSFIQYFVPSVNRVFDLSSASDQINTLRALCEGKPADVRWREYRPWILADDVSWNTNPDTQEDEVALGKMQVTGIVRGAPLSVNRLVHIPNYGDYQVERILSAPLPRQNTEMEMEIEPTALGEPNESDADSLISTNVPDELENEQTWPTEEEMQQNGTQAVQNGDNIPDAHQGTTPRRVKRVPKGWSAYQASWIVEEEDEGGDEEGEGDAVENMINEDGAAEGDDNAEPMPEEEDDEDEWEDLVIEDTKTGGKNVAFQDLDMDEDSRQLDEWRTRKREEEEAEDAEFPDELDTPKDIPARTRFQRYRGLRSFRTSPWDPYENLPRDYARIFQFEDFKLTERNIRRRVEAEGYGIEPGVRVTIVLKNVPEDAARTDPTRPFVIFGLLQHEHKTSVLNFTVQRNTEYEEPVRSKDPIILCYGPRRVRTNPIYSQHARGGGKGVNNVHKFERWLRHGITSVATTYGPVCFGNQPCFLLRESEGDSEAPALVAMGSFFNTDTTRIIAKRIVLTGHPFKVHKKTATVRYMFFNPDDVMYFAPVQLHTKYGRTGHIRESLGTHGYFKAHFDGPLNQMDTVCMSLYKRIYPKWSSLWRPTAISPIKEKNEDAMEE